MKIYTVIIGDIVNSRGFDNREEIQKELKSNIEIINKLFSEYLIKKINFTNGDEFQGIFSNYNSALLAMSLLIKLNYKIKLRFGVGTGNLNINPSIFETTNELDGTCYHNARSAIDSIKDSAGIFIKNDNNNNIDNILLKQFINNYNDLNETNRLIYLFLNILNPIMYKNIIDEERWNEIFKTSIDFNDLKWRGLNNIISKYLNMTTQNISKNIIKYHLKDLLTFENIIYNNIIKEDD